MPVHETVAVAVRLSAFVHEEDGEWVAGCPSLDVFSQGDSREDAKAQLQEAVELWIESCLERNKLGEALLELGWYRVRTLEDDDGESVLTGEEYPLEVRIPAYQAALLSDGPASVSQSR